MSFLTNNFAPFFVALTLSLMGWLYGGTRGGLLTPVVPWLLVMMFEVIVCFPQRREGESTHSARERAWRDMRRDPLVWTALGFLALLAVPFVNNALCPLCDAELIAAGHDASPPVPFLPFCADRLDHLNVFFWFSVSLSAMIAVKHAMNGFGKRLTLELVVWNGFALAILGFVQTAAGAPGPLWSDELARAGVKAGTFFSTFGYPNMAGDYFTTLFALAVALWRWRYDEVRAEISDADAADKRRGRFWRQNFFLIPAFVFFFAVLNTLSRASIMLVTLAAVLLFLHAGTVFLSRMHKVKRVKAGVWGAVAVGMLVFLAFNFTPGEVKSEVDTIDTAAVLDRMTGKGQYHARVATELWKDNWLFGCGGWGYIHYSIPKMTEQERKSMQMVGGINVHNDYLQFLAEHGLVGTLALLAMVVMLVLPAGRVWKALVKTARFSKGKDRPPSPVQIFAAPAPVFCIYVAAAATFIHGFGDCPLRSAAVMTLFFVMLAAADGFLPKIESDKEN